jgi:hypothetical protein
VVCPPAIDAYCRLDPALRFNPRKLITMKNQLTLALSLLSAAILSACGGGGGSSTANLPITVTGTAATGAPLAGAAVRVYDSTGSLVLSDGVVGADGTYRVTIPAGKQGPFIFVADDGDQQFASVYNDTAGTNVNITQLTNLLAASLSSSGDPTRLPAELAARTTAITEASYAAKVEGLKTVVAPLLAAVGVTGTTAASFDPVKTPFTANGRGLDKALDVLEVAITPGQTNAKVELTVKTSLNEDDTNPANVKTFQVGAGSTAPSALPTISASDLPDDGTSELMQQLLDKLTACFAVPLSSRVTATATAASHITAQACKDVFINGDPSQYLSNGSLVSKTGHFQGLFTASVPVTFSRPKFFGAVRTSQANGPQAGDMLIGYRWRDDYGNFQYERVMVRKTTTNPARLEIVGNRYLYDSAVTPYAQLRQFIQDSTTNYYSVGYSPYIARRLYSYTPTGGGAARNKYISKVTVTTPTGRSLLFCNRTGYSWLVLAKQTNSPTCATTDNMTGTSFVRLRSEYANKDTTPTNHPRVKDANVAFVATDWTEDELEAVKTYSAWKFEYEFKDTATNAIVDTATQWHRPARRVHSIREFKKIPLPSVTSAMLTDMRNAVTPTNTLGSGSIPIPANGVQVSWLKAYESSSNSAPEDAIPMTAVRIFASYRAPDNLLNPFEDRLVVRSNSSQATITCPADTEAQCERAGGTLRYKVPTGGATTPRSGYTGLDLWSRGAEGVEYVNFYATYLIAP